MAWFILIVFIVMAWGVSHLQERSNRNWKAVAPGIIQVKQSYKGIVTYVFASDQALGASCKQPPLWDIRKPLLQRTYIIQIVDSRRVQPRHRVARYGSSSKGIERIGRRPDCGIVPHHAGNLVPSTSKHGPRLRITGMDCQVVSFDAAGLIRGCRPGRPARDEYNLFW